MRILGIDLGSTSIKAVEMDSAFGRFEIHEYHEIPIAPTGVGVSTEDAVTAALSRLLKSLPKAPDRVSIALRPSLVTFRNLQLPTRDKKAIHSGIAFELDDELPFDLEQAIYDYSILSQTKTMSYVHVAATLKRTMAAALAFWQDHGIDPDLITTEGWAYRSYLNRIALNPASGIEVERPVLLAQIGHERTTLYVQWRGAPVLSRELAWGGRELTLAICQKYNIPMDQAEKAKLEHGFVIPATTTEAVTRDQIEFSDTLKLPMQELLSALRQVELTCKNITQAKPSIVLLSGGSSQVPGLARLIEDTLQITTKPLRSLTSVAASGVTYAEDADSKFLLASGLALCLVRQDKGQTITFRKGDFSKAGRSREINVASLRKPAMAFAAVSASLFLSLAVQWQVYHKRLQTTDAALERSVKTFFGQISSSAVRSYMNDPARLKTAVGKELGKQRELAKLFAPNPASPLDFLKELSSSVSKDVVVDMVQYQVGAAPASSYLKPEDTSATLSFIVSNPQVAERLASILGNKLTAVQRGKTEEVASASGGEKKWKVTFSGKPTEDSYGK